MIMILLEAVKVSQQLQEDEVRPEWRFNGGGATRMEVYSLPRATGMEVYSLLPFQS
jgi:hypothetical protein